MKKTKQKNSPGIVRVTLDKLGVFLPEEKIQSIIRFKYKNKTPGQWYYEALNTTDIKPNGEPMWMEYMDNFQNSFGEVLSTYNPRQLQLQFN